MANPENKVLIGCREPSGLLLEVFPLDAFKQSAGTTNNTAMINPVATIQLYGINRSTKFLMGKGTSLLGQFGQTWVDKSKWDAWKKQNASSQLLRNGVVFECKNEDEFEGKVKETKNELTGFEGLKQGATQVNGATLEAEQPKG